MRQPDFESTYGNAGQGDIYLVKCQQKVTHKTLEEADEVLAADRKRHHDDTLNKFICPYCAYYHLGHGRISDGIDKSVVIGGYINPELEELSVYQRPGTIRATEMFMESTPVTRADGKDYEYWKVRHHFGILALHGAIYAHDYPEDRLWVKRVHVRAGETAAFALLQRVIYDGYGSDLETGNFGLRPDEDRERIRAYLFRKRSMDHTY